MPADRQKVHIQCLAQTQRLFAPRLHRVTVQQHPRVLLAQQSADLRHRQNAAHLIVDRHHGYQHSLIVHCIQHLLRRDFSFPVRL